MTTVPLEVILTLYLLTLSSVVPNDDLPIKL